MRICKVWDADYPWDVRVEKICRSLGREYEVHLVSRNSKRLPVYEYQGGLHIHRLPIMSRAPAALQQALAFPAFVNPIWLRAIWRTARQCGARALLVRDLPLALTSLLVGRALGVPVILDMAENYPAMIQDVWDAGRARPGDWLVRNPRVIRLVERVVVRLADHILVVVDESRDRLAAMGVPSLKMSVVMNTPSVESLDKTVESLDKTQGGDSSEARRRDDPVIVYLGLLEAPRGLVTAIRAMPTVRRQATGARLVIIGSGRDEGQLRDEARRAGVTDCVEFLGWRDYREALRYVSRCDIGLVPHRATESWQTTIPNKLFDYMSLGKPVIVSNARPTERIVTMEQCGVVFEDGNEASFAGAVARLSDPGVRDVYGRRGRQAVVRRYNWNADEGRLLEAFRQVIRPFRPSRSAEPGVCGVKEEAR